MRLDLSTYHHQGSQSEMNNVSLLNKPEVLLDKLEIGVQIGGKIPRKNGFQFRKIQSNELTYTHIGFRDRD